MSEIHVLIMSVLREFRGEPSDKLDKLIVKNSLSLPILTTRQLI